MDFHASCDMNMCPDLRFHTGKRKNARDVMLSGLGFAPSKKSARKAGKTFPQFEPIPLKKNDLKMGKFESMRFGHKFSNETGKSKGEEFSKIETPPKRKIGRKFWFHKKLWKSIFNENRFRMRRQTMF